MDKTKIFIINTKGDIRYTNRDGEVVVTNFEQLVEHCDEFFPPVALKKRADGIEREDKEAMD